MLERLKEETDEAVRCSICGNLIDKGENYVDIEGECICANCAENLELWQVLEMLDFSKIIDLFEEKGKTKRA